MSIKETCTKNKKQTGANMEFGDFDWTPYENGYNGKNLVPNSRIKTGNKRIKVYCHEPYAKAMFSKYMENSCGDVAKDLITGAIIRITDVYPDGLTSIMAITSGGGSITIDLNKEREYLKIFGSDVRPEDFVNELKDPESKKIYLGSMPQVKVMQGGRPSLLEGHLEHLQEEFMEQIKTPSRSYTAHILCSNRGGYIVDVQGMRCFLPGGQAAPGIIADFDSMIGTDVPVMIANFVKGQGFVVSYKKYLSSILPQKIADELSIDMAVKCKVTGVNKHGIFVLFDDNNGESVFSGLIKREEMCDFLEVEYDEHTVVKGDIFVAYIHNIYVNDEGEHRIVLGDTPTTHELYIKKRARIEYEQSEESTIMGDALVNALAQDEDYEEDTELEDYNDLEVVDNG